MVLIKTIRPLPPYLWRLLVHEPLECCIASPSMIRVVVVSLGLALMGVPFTSYGQPFEMDTIQWAGDADQRINVVFFGDGYKMDELDKYSEDVNLVVDHFFSQTPFKEYRSYFNIIAFQVPSNESGAARDPNAPLDTYFGSSYNSSEIERLLVATRPDRAQQILFDQFPLYDQAVLVVNDNKYGGSGGWLATTSTHQDAPEIALHEIGHSFAGLSDEYWAGAQFARETPNMTRENDPQKVKWSNWIGYKSVEVFAHGEDPQWHRPHENCKMRILNPVFCPVCTEAITKRIQSLVKPTLGFSPEDLEVTLQEDTVMFAVDLLTPNPNTFHFDWQLEHESWPDAGSAQQKLHSSMFDPGTYQWDVTYFDSTSLVRDETHRQSITYSLNWIVQNEALTPTIEQNGVTLAVYPNPTSTHIVVEIDPADENLSFDLRDLLGRVILSGTLANHSFIDLTRIQSGIYQFSVFSGNRILSQAIVKY